MAGPKASILQFLAQIRPSGTGATALYAPARGEQVILKTLYIANLTNVNRKYSLYFDNDGTNATDVEAIAKDIVILKNTTIKVDLDIPMRDSSGLFSVQSDAIDSINFTLFGLK